MPPPASSRSPRTSAPVDEGVEPALPPYPVSVELAAYLGTVTATVTMALGFMWVVATVLGRRIEDQGKALGARIGDLATTLGNRLGRLEAQNDAIIGAVGDLGQRVAQLEARES